MIYPSGIKKSVQSVFGGLNHNVYARSDELYDMQNLTLTSTHYLDTQTEIPRRHADQTERVLLPRQYVLCGRNDLIQKRREYRADIDRTEKTIVGINDYIVILPDKSIIKRATALMGILM